MKKKRAVVIGGHSTPALALTAELQTRGWRVYFFGTKYTSLQIAKIPSYEFQTLRCQQNVHFVPIKAASWPRNFSWSQIKYGFLLTRGFLKSLLSLIKIRPRVVVGFGGYLAPPVVAAAWFLHIPIVIHEQTAVLGLANRFCLPLAAKVAVAFPSLEEELAAYKPKMIGNILRPEVMHPDIKQIRLPLRSLNKRKLLYVTGGKTGSVSLNDFVAANLQKLLKLYYLVHQTGELQFKKFQYIRQSLPPRQRSRYFPLATFNGNEVGWLLSRAKLIISRAGANIVSELAWWQTPSILVPLPNSAGDEQRKNAQWLTKLGPAQIVEQQQLPHLLVKDLRFVHNRARNGEALKQARRNLAKSRQQFADLVESTAA